MKVYKNSNIQKFHTKKLLYITPLLYYAYIYSRIQFDIKLYGSVRYKSLKQSKSNNEASILIYVWEGAEIVSGSPPGP